MSPTGSSRDPMTGSPGAGAASPRWELLTRLLLCVVVRAPSAVE